jgi:hypothetical protein
MLYKRMSQLVLGASLLVLSSAHAQEAAPPAPTAAQAAAVVPSSGGIRTIDDVVTIFRNAAMSVTKSPTTGEVVVEESSVKVIMTLDEPKKMLIYTLFFSFDAATSTEERIQLANKLNYEVVLARFYVNVQQGTLVIDYALSYEDGITPAQVVRALRWVCATVVGGIQTYDTNKIVK